MGMKNEGIKSCIENNLQAVDVLTQNCGTFKIVLCLFGRSIIVKVRVSEHKRRKYL